MSKFWERHPFWSLIIVLVIAVFIWAIFAPWPSGITDMFGRKKVFLNALFSGVTLGALYFLAASGFTLIFGLMQNVNLAHGSLYLLGGYVGYQISVATADASGNVVNYTFWWLLAFVGAFLACAIFGMFLQYAVFRRMEGDDLKQTLVTIGISIVAADLMLWYWGGDFYTIATPQWLAGPTQLPLATAVKSSGDVVFLKYPSVRLLILVAAIVIGVLMWLALNRTRVGMLVRAGVDDRDMLSASGVRIQRIFILVFAFGAGLAGIAGVVGGTFQSLAPGEDTSILLSSLVVVIVGGMGSIPGAALGALIIGLAEQFGSVYLPTYAPVLTFVIMAGVLAFRPQGLITSGR
jgi:branched-chain amino acid transport system permease protein